MKERMLARLREEEYDVVFLTSPANVTYVSEFDVPFFGGFMADMAEKLPMVTAVLYVEEGKLELIASAYYKNKLIRAGYEDAVFFECFSHLTKHEPVESYRKAVKSLLKGKKSYRKIGIESVSTPYCLAECIREIFPTAQLLDVKAVMEHARKIKTADEIKKLECAALAADAAQNRLVELSKEYGEFTELDVWFEVQKSISRVTGEMNPFYGELVTGPRTALSDYPLGPANRKIEAGDIAIMDVGPRVDGYWSDCSNVVVFWKEPNEEQLRYFRAVRAAYEAGRDAIYPGVSFRAVNDAMEDAYRRHGFELCSYLGHQIGVNVNEKPRFTLHETEVLEEDMVVCIEPQLYTGSAGATGVRLEKMLHVTRTGARELNRFAWGIEAEN